MRIQDTIKSNFQHYFESIYPFEANPLVGKSRKASEEFGKLGISMSHLESRILGTLIRGQSCSKFVEIGTLTGATAVWIAESLQENGQLWTFEKDLKHAEAAQKIFDEYHSQSSGHSGRRIHLKVGDAVEMLPTIESEGPFDGIFIDGNKAAYCQYLDWAELNLRKGGLIIGDNVFLGGAVLGELDHSKFSPKQISVMREFNLRLANPEKYMSTLLPTAEGLMVAVKLT